MQLLSHKVSVPVHICQRQSLIKVKAWDGRLILATSSLYDLKKLVQEKDCAREHVKSTSFLYKFERLSMYRTRIIADDIKEHKITASARW